MIISSEPTNSDLVVRALRGHGEVHMALQSLIVSDVFDLEITSEKQTDQPSVT